MILYNIYNAVEMCRSGLDYGAAYIYNIFRKSHKEGRAMDMMRLCDEHPEKEQIFCLANMISEAGYPFYFNFLEDLRPTPFNQGGGNPEADIDWGTYNFLIEVGQPAGHNLAQLSICFNQEGDGTLLELLDMRAAEGKPDATAEDGELTRDMTAEAVMEIIEKYFDAM